MKDWSEALEAVRSGGNVKVVLRAPDGPGGVERYVSSILDGAGLRVAFKRNHWTPNSPHGVLHVEVSGGGNLFVIWTPGKAVGLVSVEVGNFDVQRYLDSLSSSNIGNSAMRLMSYVNYPEG